MSLKTYDPLDDDGQKPVLNESSALSRIESAQIDMQVATAKKYPRSIKEFMKEAEAMVSLSEDVATECFYKLKRNGPDGVKFIEGASVRLLEIAASAYGNIYYGATPMGEDGDFTSSLGVAWDLEKNVRSSLQVRRRITTKNGSRFGADMIAVTSNAASSIAKRNALNGVVPRVYVDRLLALAKKVAIGEAKPLEELRAKMLHEFSKVPVSKEQILVWLDVKELEDINREHILDLRGVYTAIKSGESTVDEEFPTIKPEPKGPSFVGKEPDKTKPAVKETAKEAKKTEAPAPKPEPKVEAPAPAPVKEPVQEPKLEVVDKPVPTDVPATEVPKPADPSRSQSRINLEALMERDGVSEERVFYFCTSIHKPTLIQKAGPIKELWAASDAKLNLLAGNWDDYLPQLQDDALFSPL